MRSLIALFYLAATALAYTVLTPSTQQNWTTQGAQLCTWQTVSTDRANFTALLVNSDFSVKQVLAALVNGSLTTTTLNPPSTGWPVGTDFRLNFVQDAQNLDAILAQSSVFSILPPNNTGSSTLSLPTTASSAAAATTATGIVSTTTSTSSTTPPSSAASPSMSIHSGLLSIFALVGFLFA